MTAHPITRLPAHWQATFAAQATARSIPLFVTGGSGEPRFGVQGTAALLRTAVAHYLLTAGHVLAGIDLRRVAAPAQPGGGSLLPLAGTQPQLSAADHDLAAVPIPAGHPLAALAAHWAAIDASGSDDPGGPSRAERGCLIAGFPNAWSACRLRGRDGVDTGPITQLYSWGYRGPVLGRRGHDDLFLEYGLHARDADDRWLRSPALEGISGSMVWAVPLPEEAFDSEDTPPLRVAGVQTAYLHSRYLRCTRWRAVREFLARIESGR